MDAARVNNDPEKPTKQGWSVLDGYFDPEKPISESQLDILAVHVRNSGETINIYMATLIALEVSNPELMNDVIQKINAENDLIDMITRLDKAEYTSDRLDELRTNVPEFESDPPPVMQALEAIFKALQEKAEEEEWKKKKGKTLTPSIKARAYSAIRGLYLVQTGQLDKFPMEYKAVNKIK